MTVWQRGYLKRVWLDRGAWSQFVWAGLGTVSLLAGLLVWALFVELLSHRGQLSLPARDLPELERVAGSVVSVGPSIRDSGLTPTAYRTRKSAAGQLLSKLITAVPGLATNSGALSLLVILAVLCAAGRVLSRTLLEKFAQLRAERLTASQRTAIHRQALRIGPGELDAGHDLEVRELFTGETERLREALLEWWKVLPRESLDLLGLLALLLFAHTQLALQCLVPLAASLWVIAYERRQGREQRLLITGQADAELRLLAESLRKTRLIRGYAMDQLEHERFEQLLARYSRDMLAGRNQENWSVWTARAFVAGLATIMLYLIGVTTVRGELILGTAALLTVGLVLLALAVMRTWELPAVFSRALTASSTIQRYLQKIPTVSQAVGAKFFQPVSQSIIFESVSYQREGREFLKGLDLRLPARSTTALVSLDRAEVRAIAYLLPRFIEPDAGRVLFDSEDIAWGTLESLRAETLYVGGDDLAFTGSVFENLTCGDSRRTLTQAIEAAKLVHAHQFIARLPQGYDTRLGEHGEQLDLGQLFLLGLARAALRNPALLIIEEPSTALDTTIKDALDDAYARLLGTRTTLFLPARLSTIRRSDQVVLVHKGSVAAIGKHAELVKSSDLYRHWEYEFFNPYKRGEHKKSEQNARS